MWLWSGKGVGDTSRYFGLAGGVMRAELLASGAMVEGLFWWMSCGGGAFPVV